MKQAIFVPVLLVVLLLCGALDSYGQGKWPKRFYIGANHVRCDLQAVSSWPRYIYTTDSSWRTLGDSLRLKEGKFDQLGDLGINLAGLHRRPCSCPASPVSSSGQRTQPTFATTKRADG